MSLPVPKSKLNSRNNKLDHVSNEETSAARDRCLNNLIIFITASSTLHGIYISEFSMIIVFTMSFLFKKWSVDFLGSDIACS